MTKKRLSKEEIEKIIERDRPGWKVMSEKEIEEYDAVQDAWVRIKQILAEHRPGWSVADDAEITIKDVRNDSFFIRIKNNKNPDFTLAVVIANGKIMAEQG